MSQVRYRTAEKGKKVEVVGGWDRPLATFFVTIFQLEYEGEDEADEARSLYPDTADVEGFKAALAETGIEVGAGFWERVERKEGNSLHIFTGGEWVERSW